MYLESAYLRNRRPPMVFYAEDTLIDMFKEIEQRIKKKTGQGIRLLPERAYKEGLHPEPDQPLQRNDD